MAVVDRPLPDARRIGLWMATALVVGNMIGSGLFLLPAALAPFGADNIPGWLLTAAGAITLGLVFARLSTLVGGAGGPYAYTRAAFGDLPGFAVGWGYWVSTWVGNAAIATAAAGYAGQFFPWMIETPAHTALATLALVWLLTLVNCAGIRTAAWVQGVTTVLKLLPLVAVAVLLAWRLPSLEWSALGAARVTLNGAASVATLALWAMLGLESATIPADKVSGSGATVRRATLLGTVATVLVTTLACAAVLLLVPASRLVASSAPFAEPVKDAWGAWAGRAVSLFAAISAIGALNGWILVQGELPRVMARDGLFPRALGRTSASGTPVPALVATSVLVTALVLLNLDRTLVGVFTFFVLLSTTATLVAYLACSLALLRLRAAAGARGLALLGTLGALYSLAALAGAGQEAVLWGAVLLLAGLPAYVGLKRARQASRLPL